MCVQNQVMVALVGAAVFHGAFYPQCHIVQLRVEYLVTGPEVAQVRKRELSLISRAASFHCTFYPQCHIVQLHVGYLVKGPDAVPGEILIKLIYC